MAEEGDMCKKKSISEKSVLSDSPTFNTPDFKIPKDADILENDVVPEKQDSK